MSWSNDTSVTVTPAPESAASLLRELLLHHGLNATGFLFKILPTLSTIAFIRYTRSHFARDARHESDDYIEPKKKILSLYLGIFELLIPVLQAFTDGLDMGGLAPVNYLMGFVAAITGYVIFDRECETGYRPSKSVYVFVILWMFFDLCKTWAYMMESDSRMLAAGGYATAHIRYQLLNAMLTPGPPPKIDLAAFLRQCEARAHHEMTESARERRSEARSNASTSVEFLAPRSGASEKTKDMKKVRRKAS